MPPHGHGNNKWAVEPSLANAEKNGGYWENIPLLHNQWSRSTGAPLPTSATSGVPFLTAVSANQVVKFACDATTGATTTAFYTFPIPETFAQDEAKLKFRLLVTGSLATLTSITVTPTLLTWSVGSAVKTAIASTATKRWASLPSAANGQNAQSGDLGSPTATGTTTFLGATMTTPSLVEIDFTPGATTARTNYPKAGDIATLKLVSVGNTTDATDNITIMAAWCSLVRHAAMYRLSDRV